MKTCLAILSVLVSLILAPVFWGGVDGGKVLLAARGGSSGSGGSGGTTGTGSGKGKGKSPPKVITPDCDPPCPAGEICDLTQSPPVCVKPPSLPQACDPTAVPSQCPAGQVCDPTMGICIESCVTKGCDSGFICDPSGLCVPEPPPVTQPQCDASNPCPTGLMCDAGSCVPIPCRFDTDCPTDFICDQTKFVCVPKPSSWFDHLKTFL